MPLIHQTNIFTINLSGTILDIEPKEITRPSGRANNSVSEKIRKVV
jgi:hypothetical protein